MTEENKKTDQAVEIAPIALDKAIEPLKEGKRYTLLPKGTLEHKQIIQILQPTPQEHIRTREGRGGKTFTYVSGVYIKKQLNYIFGWDWDFEVLGEFERAGHIVVKGRLIVRTANGVLTKTQYGSAEIKYLTEIVEQNGRKERISTEKPVDLGDDYKSAATDALKKCASELGIAGDVYGKSEFRDATASERKAQSEAWITLRTNIENDAYTLVEMRRQLKQLENGAMNDLDVDARSQLIALLKRKIEERTPAPSKAVKGKAERKK